ncbi:MAG TPA: glycosyltransferase family 2 protein [Candidatus Dormibacteraeota bacterium]|nr:glycosyltransferase family 2 protein [Candidatus Dormibacteraeota bacterium]
MATVDVLVPTMGRPAALAVTLTSLLGQTFRDFDVAIADQTPDPDETGGSVEVRTVIDALRWRGHRVELHHRPERRGMAEQREFLLSRARGLYAHYIDDDVLLEPPVMERMLTVLREEGCGFVGCAAAGLSYLDDERPHQQRIELWEGPVRPEPIAADRVPWHRSVVNSAANPLHLERRLTPDGRVVRYKVAWVGGANVLFDRAKLLEVGGFSFWRELPPEHAGEEVLVQLLLLRTHGGCGILPCGTYHQCLPTNVPDRRRNAVELLAGRLAAIESYTQN